LLARKTTIQNKPVGTGSQQAPGKTETNKTKPLIITKGNKPGIIPKGKQKTATIQQHSQSAQRAAKRKADQCQQKQLASQPRLREKPWKGSSSSQGGQRDQPRANNLSAQNKGAMQTQHNHEGITSANHTKTPDFHHAKRRTTPKAAKTSKA